MKNATFTQPKLTTPDVGEAPSMPVTMASAEPKTAQPVTLEKTMSHIDHLVLGLLILGLGVLSTYELSRAQQAERELHDLQVQAVDHGLGHFTVIPGKFEWNK